MSRLERLNLHANSLRYAQISSLRRSTSQCLPQNARYSRVKGSQCTGDGAGVKCQADRSLRNGAAERAYYFDGAPMKDPPKPATRTLDDYFPEMRWRCLSLAADLDRVQRAGGTAPVMS